MNKNRLLSISLLVSALVGCNAAPTSNMASNTTANANFTAQREIISAVVGDSPNFGQVSNGNFLSVVSRNQGRGAKVGALVEFYYPNYNMDHLWDAYNGISYNGKFQWFHDMKLVRQRYVDDTGMIETKFQTADGILNITTQDVAARDTDTHVRRVTIQNKSGTPVNNVSLFFYEYLTINTLPMSDICEFNEQQSALHHYQDKVHFMVAMDRKADQWQCGGAQNSITNAKDAMDDATDGQLQNNRKVKAYIGLGVNGALRTTLGTLAPNAEQNVLNYIAVGNDENSALNALTSAKKQSWESIADSDKRFWDKWIASSVMPKTSDSKSMTVYKRALITIKQDTANNGAIIAAPTTTSPVYKFTWPRDGTFISMAYLETGHPQEARKFFDFISSVQKPNGGWAINYFPDGRSLFDFGDSGNEHDEVATIPWGIYTYYQYTKDSSWLTGKWNTVKKACDYLLTKIDPKTGLLGPCRDLWELSQKDSWTFTNAAGSSGLLSGAEIADKLGYKDLATKYRAASEKLKTAIYDNLWVPESGYYARGINLGSMKPEATLEAANLGLLYPFNVFDAKDARIQQTFNKINLDLRSSWGGIKRYTGDKYYDGQPWPVTTDWLAICYNMTGDNAKARQLHQVVTKYACQTESYMLGEQYDEAKQQWLSSLPLTWSEAMYVLAALNLDNSKR